MKTIEYRTVNKLTWGRGAWEGKPDKKQFVDEATGSPCLATGLPCLIVRNPMGALCGYVGVPEGHPFYEKDYDEVEASVHGGLTFASFCQEVDNPCEGVCHLVEEGEPDNVWWLGFDCNHAGDIAPGMHSRLPSYLKILDRSFEESYKDMTYVEAEVKELAAQVKSAG